MSRVKFPDNSVMLVSRCVDHQRLCNSYLLSTMLAQYGDSYVFELPAKFAAASQLYKNYIKPASNIRVPVADEMKSAFLLSEFLDDRVFFDYLVTKLRNHWSQLKTVVGASDDMIPTTDVEDIAVSSEETITDEALLQEVCLQLPYTEVPKQLRYRATFTEKWLNCKSNKILRLEDNLYSTNVSYCASDSNKISWFTQCKRASNGTDSSEVVTSISLHHDSYQVWRQDTQILFTDHDHARQRLDREQKLVHGPTRSWYGNGQLQMDEYFKYGKEHGLFRTWYETGQLKSVSDYTTGRRGLYTSYTINGEIYETGTILKTTAVGQWLRFNHDKSTVTITDYTVKNWPTQTLSLDEFMSTFA